MLEQTDKQLLDAFLQGDGAAFEVLFHRYHQRVFRAAYGLSGSYALAEDAAQEAFVALYRRPPVLDSEASVLGWLCKVASNRSMNMLRGERREQARIGRMTPDEAPDPAEAVEREEDRSELRRALAGLQERQIQLLVLRYAGLSYADIASQIGVASGSVGTLLARAEKALALALTQRNPMNTCIDSGTLRAYLDAEVSRAERSTIELHVATCIACQEELAMLRQHAQLASNILQPSGHIESGDSERALAQVYLAVRQNSVQSNSGQSRRKLMKPTQKRRWLAPLGAVLVALALLALPPVRAAADQVLQLFRVQAVVFVPVSQERMQQLQDLNFDGKTLFVSEPKIIGEKQEPQTVASADQAAAAIGFPLAAPTELPGDVIETTYTVTSRTQAEFQVNVESARQLLQLTGVTDITLPDALGARPITVDMSPAAMVNYRTANTTVSLMQGNAPQVSLPEGVELRDLGRAGLRVFGMAPEQADALASQIDWSSTLIVPFPADPSTIRQVTINGAPGLLITAGGRSERQAQLYWQRGERFYVLQLESSDRSDPAEQIVRIAESVR